MSRFPSQLGHFATVSILFTRIISCRFEFFGTFCLSNVAFWIAALKKKIIVLEIMANTKIAIRKFVREKSKGRNRRNRRISPVRTQFFAMLYVSGDSSELAF